MRVLSTVFAGLVVVFGLGAAISAEAAREHAATKSAAASRDGQRDLRAHPHADRSPRAASVRERRSFEGRSAAGAKRPVDFVAERARQAHVEALLEGRHGSRSEAKRAHRANASLRSAVARGPSVSAQRTSLSVPFEGARSDAFNGGRRSIARAAGLHTAPDPLDLNSAAVLVQDQESGRLLYEKNTTAVLPIASITKLMTALVVLESGDSLQELIEITDADVDTEKHSSSRVRVGTLLTRAELLQLALMSSENRAAHALARRSRVGLTAFIAAMNAKARLLGMVDTQYSDPTGLSSRNVSTARDLARLVRVAADQPLIRQFSTATDMVAQVPNQQMFRNTNRLIRSGDWEIDLSKTGYISEAGRCLVMQVRIQGRPTTVVLLDAFASQARATDAIRIRRWLETSDLGRSTS
jgi:D-alanyl-D-alanine endopeptidase (penicillin-binding protein 7)